MPRLRLALLVLPNDEPADPDDPNDPNRQIEESMKEMPEGWLGYEIKEKV